VRSGLFSRSVTLLVPRSLRQLARRGPAIRIWAATPEADLDALTLIGLTLCVKYVGWALELCKRAHVIFLLLFLRSGRQNGLRKTEGKAEWWQGGGGAATIYC
jgi:hypothetical protein